MSISLNAISISLFPDPLPGAEKPNSDACDKLSVSNTIFNVTLRGGIKSGNFTDKGVVKHMDECSAYCCADGQCNVAFLIRDNCFLVSCKDYDSCQIKPALSEYYHPRLAYVNWSPPDDEIPGITLSCLIRRVTNLISLLFFFNSGIPKFETLCLLLGFKCNSID